MVDPALEAEFSHVLEEWQRLGSTLAELAERLAIETVVGVLPGASLVEVFGEFNEDWLRTLRVRRVLSADSTCSMSSMATTTLGSSKRSTT